MLQSPLEIAVIGTGISGLAAAWLLNRRHRVTVFERADRIGGHSNTIDVATASGPVAVDTGFIVYNPPAYPNLTALFRHLDVPTQPSDMSFAVSLDGGRLEYSGTDLAGLFAQRRNLLRPRFWAMLRDLMRFYREADRLQAMAADPTVTLGDCLEAGRFGAAFIDDHLLPMASAIWSASPAAILDYPAASFIGFNRNHGLLQVRNRPIWRTVTGGSRVYVERLTQSLAGRIRLDSAVRRIARMADGVLLTDIRGRSQRFDHVVIASHADQALAMLADPSNAESALLGAFRYSRNLAALHNDATFMPLRRRAWSSWNHVGGRGRRHEAACVTYWMNRLQAIPETTPLFVTLNPPCPPRAGTLLHSEIYDHPIFDARAIIAQRQLWSLQGARRTWFCGSYFGSGFHEDGLQAGLAVAEQLGGVARPWTVADPSGRIVVTPLAAASLEPSP